MSAILETPILETRGLTRRFGGLVAVNDVSLSVAAGSIHAVIGPNGSGKTTLFNLISGVYRPSAGRVRLDGADVTGFAPERLARHGLARTFQNTRVFASMTVFENVLVVRHARGLGLRFDAAQHARARELLALVGLSACADQPAATLPQGQRRLLEIAKALAIEPRIILLDEPHGGLNHEETAELIEVIRRIHATGKTILLIEHEMDVVMRLAHGITVLNFGQVLKRGTPAEVQADEAVIEAYLGRPQSAARSAVAPARAPRPAAAPLLEVQSLVVRYGDIEAVRGVSLTVGAGEIVALLGANGAGKSTTLKAICRLVAPASGAVRWQGRSVLDRPTEALIGLGIALVPEQRRLFAGLSVIENLRIGAHGRPAAEVRAALAEVLALFPSLERLAHAAAFALSGGEQQMLAIGRALMSRPLLLLLDEPSLGLAPLLVEQVFAKLRETNARGTAILLVEQNARAALAIAGRAYVLGSGRVIAAGTPSELAADRRMASAYLGTTLAAE